MLAHRHGCVGSAELVYPASRRRESRVLHCEAPRSATLRQAAYRAGLPLQGPAQDRWCSTVWCQRVIAVVLDHLGANMNPTPHSCIHRATPSGPMSTATPSACTGNFPADIDPACIPPFPPSFFRRDQHGMQHGSNVYLLPFAQVNTFVGSAKSLIVRLKAWSSRTDMP